MMFHLFLFFCLVSKLSTDLIMDAIFTKDDLMEKEHTPEPMVQLENSMEANDDNSVKIHTSKTDCDETTNANTEVIICEVSRLKQENKTLRSNMTCKICLDARVGKLFLPCRDLVCCEECSAAIRECPLCRERIEGTITTFL